MATITPSLPGATRKVPRANCQSNARMEKIEPPNVGDVVFDKAWGDASCQALLTEVEDLESYAQVRILEGGALRWSSPRVESNDQELSFGTWYDGNGLPCVFEDIDGDGHPEILASIPKADLTPTVFRVFRWDGQSLSLVRRSSLVHQDKGAFCWTEDEPDDDQSCAWIDYFEDGVAHVVHRRRATVTRRTVPVKPSAKGFVEVT